MGQRDRDVKTLQELGSLLRNEKPREGFEWKSDDDLTLKRSYLEHKNAPLKLQKTYEPCTCFYYNLCFNLLILY